MPINVDDLSAFETPDLTNFDPSKMDRGDNVVDAAAAAAAEAKAAEDAAAAAAAAEAEKAAEAKAAEEAAAAEAAAKAKADDAGEEGKGEQPRDENGKFTKENRIPKARFDEAVGRERAARAAAEARAAELERKLSEATTAKEAAAKDAAAEAEIAKLEEKHAELLLDGKTAEAAAVMRDIRLAERRIAAAEVAALSARQTQAALEADRFESVVARLEADYPQFNSESDLFDADLVALALAKQSQLISTGLSPSAAMDKAARDVAARFITKAEPETKQAAGLSQAKAKEDRATAQVAKNLETIAKQPPSMKQAGIDSDKAGQTSLPKAEDMTYEEFAALPAATKSKMRGDFV